MSHDKFFRANVSDLITQLLRRETNGRVDRSQVSAEQAQQMWLRQEGEDRLGGCTGMDRVSVADVLENTQATVATWDLRQTNHAISALVVAAENRGLASDLRDLLEKVVTNVDEIELRLSAPSEVDRRVAEDVTTALLH
jgi:hypothetical protein